MATRKAVQSAKKTTTKKLPANPFRPALRRKPQGEHENKVHILKKGFVCDTEPRGFTKPKGRSTVKIVVDASAGFVPLWAKNTTLNWHFNENSMRYFEDSTAAKQEIRKLINDTLTAWGTAAPVKFKEDNNNWDFEIVMRQGDDCADGGCVLASAFFPDAGRHRLYLYPFLFEQKRSEQVETLEHEFGHIFGLRHYFALLQEKDSPAEIFGRHNKFTIMNYDNLSQLTKRDRSDLTKLYKLVWSGELTTINGKPIKLFKAFHTLS